MNGAAITAAPSFYRIFYILYYRTICTKKKEVTIMKWTVYSTIKSILLVAYGLIMGPWALEAIDPIAIAFRIVVALTIIVFGAPVWCWFEDGINLKDKLE